MSHKHRAREHALQRQIKNLHEREHSLQQQLELQSDKECELQKELETYREHQKYELQRSRAVTGEELVALSVPTPITVGLLGKSLTLELPCLRLTSEGTLAGKQAVNLIGVIIQLLKLLSVIVSSGDEESDDFIE